MAHGDQADVIAFLSRLETYGLTDGRVERIETHGAIVFLAGDRAYKLKRAVEYPYMDYSTPGKRRAMCEKELLVNKRTAPEIYLEVRSVACGKDGNLVFAAPGAPSARDFVVVMRRFAQDALFGSLCEAGKLTPELMRALGDTLAAFHGNAEIEMDYGGAKGIGAVVEENNKILHTMRGHPFPADRVEEFRRRSEAALARIAAFLDRRRDEGRVRRCHGDLHLDNAVLIGGKPVLFDAIEFENSFACIDVFYDLAFLPMDLDRHEARDLANALFNRYLERTADYGGLEALPLFLASRAAIRAHVTVARAKATHRAQSGEAGAYLDLALAYLDAPSPRLVAIGGLSGTGKTTLARALAPPIGPAPGAVILRSDVTRKRLMGVEDTVRLSDSAYTPKANAKVFSDMAKTAARVLAAGHAVVMDAVYGLEEERAEIAGVAAQARVPFDGLWLEADAEILTRRIAGRERDASDATLAVLKKQLATIAPPAGWTRIDASGTPEAIAEAARLRFNRPAKRDRN